MRTLPLLALLAVAGLLAAREAAAQAPPDFEQALTQYNRQPNAVSGTATPGQFGGFLSFGAWTASVGTDPAEVNYVPGTTDNGVKSYLNKAFVGIPYQGQLVNVLFGDVIPPPGKDRDGHDLTEDQALAYWRAEPYVPDNQIDPNGYHLKSDLSNADYYWSPHSQKVFASQGGAISVTWRTADPVPPNSANATSIGGVSYGTNLVKYQVSSSAGKTPRTIFWTEGSGSISTPVIVPETRVRSVKIVYSRYFPENVAQAYTPVGEDPVTGSWATKTLWVGGGQMHAYNVQGRVLVEFLGDGSDVHREPLGTEIVDVVQFPSINDLTVELGERLPAYGDGRDNAGLSPVPLNGSESFLYRDASQLPMEYYATVETRTVNDVMVFWLEEGVAGTQWPLLLDRYRQVWPSDPARYSHYLRPATLTDVEAVQTAVPLPTGAVAAIDYQDPLDVPRAKLTTDQRFFTRLDEAHPAHRTLLRFNSARGVAFERVLSSLASAVQRPADAASDVDFGSLPGEAARLLRPGRSSVLNLDGVSGYGELPLGNYSTSGLTVEAWVYLRANSGGPALIALGAGSTEQMVLILAQNNVDRKPVFRVKTSAGTEGLEIPALSLNTWVHLAVVQEAPASGGSATGVPTIFYVNGSAVATTVMALADPRNADKAWVGRRISPATTYANAAFDDLRLWSGPRSAEQIREDMASSGYAAETSGLRAQFGFGFTWGDGKTVFDEGANHLDMTLRGGASVGTSPDGTGGAVNSAPLPISTVRYVQAQAYVGDRIEAPSGELGGAGKGGYLAGHIVTGSGDSYHPGAYLDPLVAGFEAAALGAVIPVNAIPGRDLLEVWWFRAGATNRVVNPAEGVRPVYWPAVIGRYRLAWPGDRASEIILASNAGSGGLPSLQAKGAIYVQNDPDSAGYNPNEEHALMLGGQAWALRDDLNITSGSGYSSKPYVLLSYTESDLRPAIRAFKVLREKPSAGIVFDYLVEAGQKLQAPMPLPLLPAPIDADGNNLNQERDEEDPGNPRDVPAWYSALNPEDWPDLFGIFLPGFSKGLYSRFTFEDRNHDYWVHRGLHRGLPALKVGTYSAAGGAIDPPVGATAVRDRDFSYTLHSSRLAGSLVVAVAPSPPLPEGLHFDGLTLLGQVAASVPVGPRTNRLTITAIDDGAVTTVDLVIDVRASGDATGQDPLKIISENRYSGGTSTYVGRPPEFAAPPANTNSFTMRFYYRTREDFAWPGVAHPPPTDSIVPYLRQYDPDLLQLFLGAGSAPDDPALPIVYRPYWPFSPDKLPKLDLSDTLTLPKAGLPAIRGQTSVRILYQQSKALSRTASVVLHDPTREKVSDLAAAGLAQLPSGVVTSSYQGRWYFPGLPPHLANRVFFDPSRGTKGQLVLQGEFKDEPVGEKYLLLNVLSESERQLVKGLCPDSEDAAIRGNWGKLVDGLVTDLTRYDRSATGAVEEVDSYSVGVGELAEIGNENVAVDSYALSASGPGTGYVTLVTGNGKAFTPESEPVSVHVLRVESRLHDGAVKVIAASNPLSEAVTFQHTPDLAARFDDFEYDWRIGAPVDGAPPAISPAMSGWTGLAAGLGLPRVTLGGAGIQTLGDNYVVVRYRPKHDGHPLKDQWSEWTSPQLAEGWIKRVLAGINPFNQRLSDLFNNRVDTDVSLLTQAGHRWEGDIALNLQNINDFGLIEIYETVLRRGKALSIDAGINFGPANDALLLAAGYLNDLYMLVGNEAWADAANPTIGIGTKDSTYGNIATALFAFKGQVPSVLEEELALLRGRDDFLQPGVTTPPVYNRLYWNYTRGIDAGEVIYALNYNILEDPNANPNGVVDADDARRMFPQGHGDAYGHYLTALKGYYSLLLDQHFDWVPRSEAVTVLGQPVQVDYEDERKFAAAAAAVARTGRQVFDLTWRRDALSGEGNGWEHMGATRVNDHRDPRTTRYWGMDHWAARTGQGAYLDWVVGNAILPDVDPDPDHEGIQRIDRTTVPELKELAVVLDGLQTALDQAEGGHSPLGVPEGGIAFDINPDQVTGVGSATHFEQVYGRAKGALANALVAFDDAKDVTTRLRSEQDSLSELQARVASQELAYQNSLIEIYGTPYPDDIGPGRTYAQGYAGPDLIHSMYVDLPEIQWPNLWNYLDVTKETSFTIDLQDLPSNWVNSVYDNFEFITQEYDSEGNISSTYAGLDRSVPEWDKTFTYTLQPHGFGKPSGWTGRRASPGRVQQAISEIIGAHRRLKLALYANAGGKVDFDKHLQLFQSQVETLTSTTDLQKDLADLDFNLSKLALEQAKLDKGFEIAYSLVDEIRGAAIAPLEVAGDDALIYVHAAEARVIWGVATAAKAVVYAADIGTFYSNIGASRTNLDGILAKTKKIAELQKDQALKDSVYDLFKEFEDLQAALDEINAALRNFDDASRRLQSLKAEGDRLQAEREGFRKRSAALVQGFRTRDAAFRAFRSEKLERYKALFDLAARYAVVAANAYDYETGLLNTSAGRDFVNRITRARALGVMRNGEPQYAGSDTGDPGLSSAMAEMKADWDVLKGRLGFNNADGYGTTVSLRTECFRILPGAEGRAQWVDRLQSARQANLLADADVRRQCLQIDKGDGLPVPGLIVEFSTTVSDGLNLFGRPLAAFDHYFSDTAFATKIFAVGVALEGYVGMDVPGVNGGAVSFGGGVSPSDPGSAFLDQTALAATPYLYLIPVGLDSMRSPPLGDTSDVRTWNVNDVILPLPFNIGGSDFSTKKLYQSEDSLSEPLFGTRKHQAFRPVSDASLFGLAIYGSNGQLAPTQFTNRRLIGRSVWNSKWKLIIPGRSLLNDPNEGLDRFLNSVGDIKLHFVTYSYSGN